MNKPVCLGFSILEVRKIEICKLCYDYIKKVHNDGNEA